MDNNNNNESIKQESPICSKSVDGGVDLWSCNNKDKDNKDSSSSSPDHLVILVNGILGTTKDWKFGAEQFVKQLPHQLIVHCSERNVSKLTLDGIDVMGERLAEEVVELIHRNPEARKISFVGHSMGGLVARYAIGRLYRPPKSDNTEEGSNDASDGDSRGTICGLEAMNFITVATPHLGSRGNNQVPFLFGVTAIEKVATYVIHWIFRRTGRHLFLTDADKEEVPLLRRMVDDCGDLHFMSALQAFHRRATYANVGYDHIVGWRTASIRRISDLPKWEDSVSEKYPHIVYEERCKATDVESPPISAEKGSFDVLEEEMMSGLSRVPWEKVDVSFHTSRQRLKTTSCT
ncbi:hypothetical protein AQUCO_06700019v1 [Aquilegia coerulea]|uniref:DUF676 domain-containing protein n=1 Tax=Aquilegia coerulea TaxID=218851 RepID=A0A2G5CBS1_AQUCA|nr:hypothetical protein AQUCO_06700019v1 [Aquilegia coerulea]